MMITSNDSAYLKSLRDFVRRRLFVRGIINLKTNECILFVASAIEVAPGQPSFRIYVYQCFPNFNKRNNPLGFVGLESKIRNKQLDFDEFIYDLKRENKMKTLFNDALEVKIPKEWFEHDTEEVLIFNMDSKNIQKIPATHISCLMHFSRLLGMFFEKFCRGIHDIDSVNTDMEQKVEIGVYGRLNKFLEDQCKKWFQLMGPITD